MISNWTELKFCNNNSEVYFKAQKIISIFSDFYPAESSDKKIFGEK